MKMNKKIRYFFAIVTMWITMVTANFAHAFVWPVINGISIATFVKDITAELSKITTVKAQLNSYLTQLQTIGDQVGTMLKYAQEWEAIVQKIENSIGKIKELLNRITVDLSELVRKVQIEINLTTDENKQIAEKTVNDVNDAIEDGASIEEIQKILDENRNEIAKNIEKMKELLSQSEEMINSSLDEYKNSFEELRKAIESDNDLDEESKQKLMEKISEMQEKIEEYKQEALKIIEEIRQKIELSTEQMNVAYEEYANKISDYQAGKITKEELEEAGKEFSAAMQNINNSISDEEFAELNKKAEEIATAMEDLEQDILDSLGNNKNYSDEAANQVIPKAGQQFAFNYHISRNHIYLSGIIKDHLYTHKERDEAGDKVETFLLPDGFRCDDNEPDAVKFSNETGGSGREDDVKKLNEADATTIESFRMCVINAKMEKERFCAGDDVPNNEECNPYVMRSHTKKYREQGLFEHIFQSYGTANMTNLIKTKAYINTWIKGENPRIDEYKKKSQDVTSERNATIYMSFIETAQLELWNRIRRIDALSRAKEITNLYRQLDKLYAYLNPQETQELEGCGRAEIKFKNNNNEEIRVEKNIIADAIIGVCGDATKQGFVEKIADYIKDNNVANLDTAEKTMIDCFKSYVNLSNGSNTNSASDDKKNSEIARSEQQKMVKVVLADSMFQTLLLSTMNNYKCTLEFRDLDEGKENIKATYEKVQSAKNSYDDIAAAVTGMKYKATLMLNIMDADAQYLQNEITRSLGTMNDNFFPKDDEEGAAS